MNMLLRTVQRQNQVAELLHKIDSMQKQLDEMCSRISFSTTPARDGWIRYSGPAWDLETQEVPSVRRPSLALVKPPTAIRHVTICMSGATQIVTSYDKNGQVLQELSGPFERVGMEVLDQYGENDWEMVRESVTESA